MAYETKLQKKFRLAMNEVMSIDPTLTHVIESKNDYIDYPCPNCGALDNKNGRHCIRHKLAEFKDEFYLELNN